MFYLGTHEPSWLARTAVPLFVSHRRLGPMKTLPRRLDGAPWALDSGGFSELSLFGRWQTPAALYVEKVRRYRDEVGGLRWAAIQDWMCEEAVLRKTGLTVLDHQVRTIASLLRLRSMAPDVPWVPVLQGWTRGDYLNHVEQYADSGVDLTREPVVGLGTICRRQNTLSAALTVRWLASDGLRLHGFGFKLTGLAACGDALVSSDSMAWSFDARRASPMPGHSHKNCANCLDYALRWREKAVAVSQGTG